MALETRYKTLTELIIAPRSLANGLIRVLNASSLAAAPLLS
jgi:hypothetical protein